MYGVVQVEVISDRGCVFGVGVHVVAKGGLTRAPVASPVVGDDSVAVFEEEHHLGVPVVGAEGPAVVEHDWLTVPPVLVEDLGAVIGGNKAHGESSFLGAVDVRQNVTRGNVNCTRRCWLRCRDQSAGAAGARQAARQSSDDVPARWDTCVFLRRVTDRRRW